MSSWLEKRAKPQTGYQICSKKSSQEQIKSCDGLVDGKGGNGVSSEEKHYEYTSTINHGGARLSWKYHLDELKIAASADSDSQTVMTGR